ncbi:MAG TPA: hypothetical protein VIF64_15180, partial [Pyrinomonadaceae bacterium]
AQENSSAAQDAKAAEKAAAAKRRAEEAKARARERQALAQQRRAQAHERRIAEQQKRMAEQERRIAARIAADQKRIVERAFRQARQPEGTFKFLGSRLGIEKVVKGAPYSATAITEHTQTLSDGNKIIQRNEANYYRDSEGRTRMEQKLQTIGKWAASGEPAQITVIFDPVTGNHYSLNSKTRIALLDARGPQKPPTQKPNPLPNPKPNPEPGPKGSNDRGTIPKPKEITSSSISKNTERDQHGVVKEGPQRKKKEMLGSRVIEGVSAEGTRQTITIPAGEIGNVGPIEIIDENWYSSELKVPVLTTHHDPRSGDTIYKLTNINRSEPARSLFEVPADYQIMDRRARRSSLPEPPAVPEPPKKPEDKL